MILSTDHLSVYAPNRDEGAPVQRSDTVRIESIELPSRILLAHSNRFRALANC